MWVDEKQKRQQNDDLLKSTATKKLSLGTLYLCFKSDLMIRPVKSCEESPIPISSPIGLATENQR